jgi:esterase
MLHHARVVGEGQSPSRWMLMLHGIYGAGRNWATIARQLVEQRPEWGVLLVDLRLHGGSRDVPGPHTLEAAAADVGALMSGIGADASAVLGHSFGGKVALAFARDHGEGLQQVWVIDSTLELKEPQGSAWRVIDVVRSLPPEFGSREEFVAAFAEHGYDRGVGQWLAMNLERTEEGRLRWRLDWEGVEQMLRDYFRSDVWGVIEEPPAGVEVHIARATESNAIDSSDVARILEAGSHNGRTFLHQVPGGHWVNTESPGAIVDLLVEHLPR